METNVVIDIDFLNLSKVVILKWRGIDIVDYMEVVCNFPSPILIVFQKKNCSSSHLGENHYHNEPLLLLRKSFPLGRSRKKM